MMYRVIQSFMMFEYNAKNRSHKLKRYEIGDIIKESIKNKLRNKSYVESI